MVTNFAGTPTAETCGLTGARRFSNIREKRDYQQLRLAESRRW
jgi:hypothetical protein